MPTIPTLISKINLKYITCFKNLSEFENARPNFEEVNWSCIKNLESPDHYRLSRRLSNMYNKDNPPMYKFNDINDVVIKDYKNIYPDASMIVSYNDEDNIKKTFFLEIVWGYSGWEWNTYELVTGEDPNTGENIVEILTGGNHYKVKEITKIPHIIDGDRLQHINDFLLSQDKVTSIEGFDTSNIKAANRAFKRGIGNPKTKASQIESCYLLNSYDEDNNLLSPYFGSGNTLSNLVEADYLFYNNKIYIENDNSSYINIPNITHINGLYYYGVYTDNLRFRMESLNSLPNAFKYAFFTQPIINVNNIFIGNTLKYIEDFNSMFAGASFKGFTENNNINTTLVIFDLTSSEVDSNSTINLSHLFECSGLNDKETSLNVTPNTILSLNLNFDNKIDLSYAFRGITKKQNIKYEGKNISNGGFENLSINFNNKENKIINLDYSFSENIYLNGTIILNLPNPECTDNFIYSNSTFNLTAIYDFSPSHVIRSDHNYGQFDGCTFSNSFNFSNVDTLDRVLFCNIKFTSGSNTSFPYIVHNNTYHNGSNQYKIVDFAFSEFTSIANLNIYIDTIKFRNIPNKIQSYGTINEERMNIFQRCSNLTDLSGIHLYYSDVGSGKYVFTFGKDNNFFGCESLTKSPYIHFNGNNNCYFNFNGLKNLTEVNLENFSSSGSVLGTTSTSNFSNFLFSFKDCSNLRFLKLGSSTNEIVGNIDLRGCYSLDIPTLEDSLKHRIPKASLNNYRVGDLYIMRSIWNEMSQETRDYCSLYTDRNHVTIVEDSSYIPEFPNYSI